MVTSGFEPLVDDPFKDAGVFGIYSPYYESSKQDFNRLRRSSPLKSPEPANRVPLLPRPSTPTPLRVGIDRIDANKSEKMTNSGSLTSKKNTNSDKAIPISASLGNSHVSTMPHVYKDWLEILRMCLHDLTGRDKAAKMLVYLLRLILSEGPKKTIYSSKNGVQIATFAKSPIVFVRQIALIAYSELFSRSGGSISGLNIYRQLLRAGSAPVHVIKLIRLIRRSVFLIVNRKCPPRRKIDEISRLWVNWSTITSICSLYYAWFDESLLLFNLGIIHKTELRRYHRFSSRHELLSWFATILVGLRNDYAKYGELNNRETSARIDFEVKVRAKKLLSRTNGVEFESSEVYSQKFINAMQEVAYEKRILKLDMARLSCDLVYDSVFVFNQPMYKPLHLLFGLLSGSLGFYKVWLQKGREIDEKCGI